MFVVFYLCVTVLLVGTYAIFVGHFNGHEQYEARLALLQQQVEKERLNNSLLSYQLKDFQQTVAQVLPDNNKLQAHYELKNLASVVRAPASEEALDLSSALFEKAKKSFKDNDYSSTIRTLAGMLERYPLSKHTVEAHFFIAESYFLKKDFRSSLAEIDHMVTHYPQHELTGFILLRMGQISAINNQTEEASEIYKTVAKSFKNEDLQKQARELANSIVE